MPSSGATSVATVTTEATRGSASATADRNQYKSPGKGPCGTPTTDLPPVRTRATATRDHGPDLSHQRPAAHRRSS
eukprot:CAMPEP_0204319664 /NCGR_PEP_ID=MMETSP0469-20131031/7223_1 /ASSEMBLY_ACC=CAM_ASM_000384 /TAXON_ID=2969 /ORGANISM="Oxyrrhis marina" /LENGTH=74 /DNA_ID=CAMNT_0051300859 /DNA_START=64 /DNA_END=284 /DNA_ORIENTATION=+